MARVNDELMYDKKEGTGGSSKPTSSNAMNDPRAQQVRTEEKSALKQNTTSYNDRITESEAFFQGQIDAVDDANQALIDSQNAQTEFAIDEIERQKAQAQQDYTREQSGAYADWQKQSGQYGVNAEQMAAQGLQGTGFAESSQVSMYNAYQYRVATAREAYVRAIQNYDASITEARLQNNAVLAEIAYETLQKQLELALQGFQYKNQLLSEQADREMQIKSMYQQKYTDVLAQLNAEWSQAEQVRQFNKQMAEEQRQFNASYALQQAQFEWQKAQASGGSGGTVKGGSSGGSKKSSGSSSSSKSSSGGSSVRKAAAGAIKGSNAGKEESSKKSGGVNMQSVLDLGFGPISAQKAYELVKQGIATTYVKDGETYFRLSPNALKQKMLLR